VLRHHLQLLADRTSRPSARLTYRRRGRALAHPELEPDADGDTYGDETQDLCTVDASTQSPCSTDLSPQAPTNAARIGEETVLILRATPGLSGAANIMITQVAPPGVELISAEAPDGACSGWPRLGCSIGSRVLRRSATAPRTLIPSDQYALVKVRVTAVSRKPFVTEVASDTPDPNPGNNRIEWTPRIRPRAGDCQNPFVTGPGADVLTGTYGGDAMSGGRGADRLDGERGNDCVSGGPGNDRLKGGPGRDRIDGGRGRDVINAYDRSGDTVRCGAGIDRVVANKRDKLSGCERVRLR
jgi:RTX calcium-binding nonapeptide repeat (4 copies)